MLSGPVMWAHTIYDDKSFIFFGDNHKGKSGNCGNDCLDMNLNQSYVGKNSKCIDITRYLDKLFTDAYKNDEKLDFFIEAPYLEEKDFKVDINHDSYLVKIINTFENCIYNSPYKDCPYTNVNFYYVDIRTKDKQSFTALIVHYHIFICMMKVYKNFFISREHIPSQCSKNFIQLLEFSKWFYGFDDDIRHDIELLKIYLTSDNYTKDISKFISSYKFPIPYEIKELLYSKNFYINDDNNSRTIIRYKLYQLEEKNSKLTRQIENFILNEYQSRTSKLTNIFDDLMIYYRVYNIDSKNSYLNDIGDKLYGMLNLYYQPASYSALLMDAYTLASIFISEANTIVLYQGSAHIELCINFFQEILGIKLKIYPPNFKSSSHTFNRCLSINDLNV